MARFLVFGSVLIGTCTVALILQYLSMSNLSSGIDGSNQVTFAYEETFERPTSEENSLNETSGTIFVKPPIRVLVGIFTTDNSVTEQNCRDNYRALLTMHPNVCHLSTFLRDKPTSCSLVYIFVVGANPDVSTYVTDDSRPFVVEANTSQHSFNATDMLEPDMTLLNIKENMNEGKSPTWFAYAAMLARQYSIDYIVKQDTDTLLYLDRFFSFVETTLLPAPYNRNILAGSIFENRAWQHEVIDESLPNEAWAIQKYGHLLHVFAEGQWYMLSPDLAEVVQQQYMTEAFQAYTHILEDHDVSAMAFQSNLPIQLIMIPFSQRHWRHPVKPQLELEWSQSWEAELRRMKETMHLNVSVPAAG